MDRLDSNQYPPILDHTVPATSLRPIGAIKWHDFKQHLHISGIVGEKVWDMLCCEDGLGGTAADGKPFYISMNNLRIDDRETGFQTLKIEIIVNCFDE